MSVDTRRQMHLVTPPKPVDSAHARLQRRVHRFWAAYFEDYTFRQWMIMLTMLACYSVMFFVGFLWFVPKSVVVGLFGKDEDT